MSSWLDPVRRLFRSSAQQNSLSQLGYDMHAHWLPGLDDGAASMEDSMHLLKGLEDLGYQGCIATPHVMSDYYRNSSDTIAESLEAVRTAAAQAGLKLSLQAAAEYYLDDGFFQLLKKRDILTLGEDFLLFELSYVNRPANIQQAIFRMQTGGYRPVLAHPERYPYFASEKDLGPFRELVDQGVLLQINLGSLLGHHGALARQCARELVQAGLVHFAGSDVHRKEPLGEFHRLREDRWLAQLLQSPSLRQHQLGSDGGKS